VSYDRWAKFYDQYPNPTVAADEEAFPPLWAHLKGKDVLEVGCGTGRHTVKLLAQGNRVTGLDPSEGMLAKARAKLTGEVTLLQGDFLEYDFGPSVFDALVESLVLEHVKDLPAFFTAAARCLRSGGELFLSEIHPDRAKEGALAHYKDPETGEEVSLDSWAHPEEAFEAAGFIKRAAHDVLGSEELVKRNPKWGKHLGKPLVKLRVFSRV
jgi:malonyl-CoA O-methyltransferase